MTDIPTDLKSRIIFHLSWLLADIDFRNSGTGIDTPDSPELADLRELYKELYNDGKAT